MAWTSWSATVATGPSTSSRTPSSRPRMRSAARRAIGILPGGTGNGFAREMGVPGTLREATEVLCRSDRVRSIDVGRLLEVGNVDVPDRYFIQRLYVGRRARGADESRDEGPLRRLRVRGEHGPARAGTARRVPRRGGWRAVGVPGLQGLRRELRDDGHGPADHPRLCGGRRPARRLRDRRDRRTTRWSPPRRDSSTCTRRARPGTTASAGRSASRPSRTSPSGPTGSTSGGRRSASRSLPGHCPLSSPDQDAAPRPAPSRVRPPLSGDPLQLRAPPGPRLVLAGHAGALGGRRADVRTRLRAAARPRDHGRRRRACRADRRRRVLRGARHRAFASTACRT